MLGWCSFAALRISPWKRSRTPAVDQVAADDLEDLHPAHQGVLGEEDDAHAALAEFPEDLVVGEVGEPGGRVLAGGGAAAAGPASSIESPSVEETAGREIAPRLGVAESAEEAVGGDLGDAAAAIRAALQVRVHRFGRGVVELAQAVGLQGLVGRMQGGRAFMGSVSGSSRAVRCADPQGNITKA